MRLKTLNGAPLCKHLDFSPETLLGPEAAVQYLNDHTFSSPASDTTTSLKWRHLPPRDTRLHTGWSQPYLPQGPFPGSQPNLSFSIPSVGDATGFTPEDTTDIDATISYQDQPFDNTGFVEHSLNFHDTLLSSQVATNEDVDGTFSSTSFFSTSFETASTEIEREELDSQEPIVNVPATIRLTPLGSLPSAACLRSISPQTPTPNIVCVLAAPLTEKEVLVRKSGYKMNLRELTVADDTKSDFIVSFWRRPSNKQDAENPITQALDRVQVGDVLLLRNIALNTFRDKVYGQSLNPFISRARTTVDVLTNDACISTRQLAALPAPVAAAVTRLRKWANLHIAPSAAWSRKRKGGGESNQPAKRAAGNVCVHYEILPPDTPDVGGRDVDGPRCSVQG